MGISMKKKKLDSGNISLSFDGAATIYTVKKLKDLLMPELKESQGLELNLSNVKQIDTAGFQLLVFIKREAENAGKRIILTEASNEVNTIFSFYNEKYTDSQ